MTAVSVPVASRRIVAGRHALPALLFITALVYAAYIAVSIRPYGNNLSALIVVGDQKARPSDLGHHVVVFRHTTGYDGLLYYYVANDPFLRHPRRQATLFYKGTSPRAAFIYQRIGYPLVVWAVSLGQRAWRPVVMVGVNVVAVLAIALLAWLIIRHYGKGVSPWWALVCAINPCLLIGVQMDLAEPLAIALSLTSLLLYLRRRIGWAALVFAAALLTREVTILFLLPVLAAELLARRFRPMLVLAISVVPYLLWEAVLWQTFGHAGATTSESNFDVPLAGISAVITAARHASLRYAVVHQGSILAVAVIVFVALGVAAVQMRKRYDVMLGGILAHSAAALCASWWIWTDFASAARVFGGLYLLIVFAYARYRTTALALLAGAVVLLTLSTLLRAMAISPAVPYYLTP